jgi:YVTN family beta-propeller protein
MRAVRTIRSGSVVFYGRRAVAWILILVLCPVLVTPGTAVGSGGAIATIPVGAEPVGVAVDSLRDKTYVATRADNAVTVIQGLAVVATVPVGTFPRQLAVNAETNKIYVTNFMSDNVSVIDGSTDEVVATIPVGAQPFGVAVNPVTNRIYVSGLRTNSLWVIDGVTDTVIDRIPLRANGPGQVAVNTVTDTVYVPNSGCCNNEGRTVSVIDGATDKFVTSIDLGHKANPETLAVNEVTNRVYVGDLCSVQATNTCFKDGDFGQTLSVIDGASNTVVDHVRVGTAPFGPSADSERNTVYVPNLFSNTVSVIDGATNAVIDTIPVGTLPAGAGVNTTTNLVYVSNLGDNTVSVLPRE